jgi:hypothetical protein
MEEVDMFAVQHRRDRLAVPGPGAFPRLIIKRAAFDRHRDEPAGDPGIGAGDHDGAVAGPHQSLVEMMQHLLGAADRIRPDRRERIGNAENPKAQAGSCTASSSSAARASACQRAPVMPQP